MTLFLKGDFVMKENVMLLSEFCSKLGEAFPSAKFVTASPSLGECYEDGIPISLMVSLWTDEAERFFKEKAGFSRFDGWGGVPGLITTLFIKTADPYEESTNVFVSYEEYGNLKELDWSDVVIAL